MGTQAARRARDAVTTLAARLRGAGVGTPELDARLLVCAALAITHEQLLIDPERMLTREDEARLEPLARRREAREPVSRILGVREFRGREFALSDATLDPRPDSETLVEAALELFGDEQPGTILDLGTGTGCLLLALLAAFPGARGLGVDVSGEAVATARANAERLGLAGRARFREGDWLEGIDGRFDLVVSNPPYIPSGDIAGLEPEVARHDPAAALDGGPDGLDAYRRILPGLARVLGPGATALLEIGAGQESAVRAIAREAGLGPDARGTGHWRDLGGHVRCVALARQGVIQ
ncbi:MAG: peptide chain release factor N(5)-glutamine methyltransferase [Hyphomicrobiales bacterium]